jgi:hypothetical protein
MKISVDIEEGDAIKLNSKWWSVETEEDGVITLSNPVSGARTYSPEEFTNMVLSSGEFRRIKDNFKSISNGTFIK